MTSVVRPRSPLWMVVLALAVEEPMHPYRMQTLIKQRNKDEIANVAQRNSVYQTIDALRRAGLITIRGMSREERRPERTTYEATEEGRAALRSWVRAGLSTIAREYPLFPAALSTFYGIDSPRDLRSLLEIRVTALEGRLSELVKPVPNLPRLFLLESEHAAAMVRAEIRWLRSVIGDLQSGKLTFPTEAQIRRIGADIGAPSDEALKRMVTETRNVSVKRQGRGSDMPSASPAKERTLRSATRLSRKRS